MKYFVSFSVFLLLSSCGLKVTNEIDDNVLLGSWKLDSIQCFQPNDNQNFVESYDISVDESLDITIDFISSSIQYMVSSDRNMSDDCSTSSTAMYKADFNGTGAGLVDIYQVVLGSIEKCKIEVPFTGNGGGGGTGSINLTMNSNYSRDLNWSISDDRETLILDFFTDFKGSDSSYCNGLCNCKGTYAKK